MQDHDIPTVVRFFSHYRTRYEQLNIGEMAKQCDAVIALVEKIALDPRLDPSHGRTDI
jgi:uncharacterized protein (UPF0147 family)